MSNGIRYEDVVNAVRELKKEGWLPSEPKKYGKLFNPSKRYQITIGISNFGERTAHIIPINEFDHEDWECPKCHSCMQDIILYKDKLVRCQHCGLELWRENHGP